MKKRKSLFIFYLAVLFLFFAPISQAVEIKDVAGSQVKEVFIDSTLSVTKLQDGRIAPVRNSHRLSENQINKILLEMNVSYDELEKLSPNAKKQIVSHGGIKVEMEGETRQYYNSLDGQKYLITKENQEEIEKIKEKDKSILLSQSNEFGTITPLSIDMGSESDGIWSAESILFYSGTINNEYRYDLYTSYYWSDFPNFFIIDSIAHSWDIGISSEDSSGLHWWPINYLGNEDNDDMDITRKPGGTKGDLDLSYYRYQYGTMHDELRVGTMYDGQTKQIAISYVHPWIGGVVGVVLDFFGINWDSFTGDEWHWDGSFVVGESE